MLMMDFFNIKAYRLHYQATEIQVLEEWQTLFRPQIRASIEKTFKQRYRSRANPQSIVNEEARNPGCRLASTSHHDWNY
jgi:hypothetical protein